MNVIDQLDSNPAPVQWGVSQHCLGVVGGIEVALHLREGALHRAARVGRPPG